MMLKNETEYRRAVEDVTEQRGRLENKSRGSGARV